MYVLYKPDIGTVISLNTGATITGATSLSIEVKKPSGATASWPGSIGSDNQSVEHTIVANDLTETGNYILQPKLTLGGTWHGASVQIAVRDVFN